MKNLHLIPTDKPSRLHYFTANKAGYYLYPNNELIVPRNPNCINQNIYITSDEEIKEGDWFYNTLYNFIARTGDITAYDFKIILTTNKLLIKDGVQAIDEEFLQWFVKNSNCEKVEVETDRVFRFDEFHGREFFNRHKIIIPKEEPKDIILGYKTSLDAQMLNSQYVDFSNPNADKISSASTTSFKQETHICKHCGVETTQSDDECYAKPETLEEAAKNYVRNESDDTLKLISKYSFKDGAKWQMERMYSEEELQLILSKLLFDIKHKKAENSVKWFEQFKKK